MPGLKATVKKSLHLLMSLAYYVDLIVRPPRSNFRREDWISRDLPSLKSESKNLRDVELLEVENRFGDKVFSALFHPTAPAPHSPCVIFAHGNACDITTGIDLLDLFLPSGISVLSFTFPGCGDSEPKIITFGLREHETIIDLVKFLRTQRKFERIGIYGHSMGAFATLLAIEKDPSVTAAVLASPFPSIKEQLLHWASGRPVDYGAIRAQIKAQHGFDIDLADGMLNLDKIRTPTCICHCIEDRVVPEQGSARIATGMGSIATRFVGNCPMVMLAHNWALFDETAQAKIREFFKDHLLK